MKLKHVGWVAVLAVVALVAPSALAQGSIKSQVIWSDKNLPKNDKANVDKDKEHCLSKGDILKNDLIVDPKTKGVKNVVFWLVDAKNPTALIPTPEALKTKVVEIDQPCCVFIPRHTVILAGQKLVVKNGSPIAHNIKISGGADGPELNISLPAGGKLDVGEVKARSFPIVPYSCSIHAWMNGYLMPLPSPYYAITDAEGKFEIKDVPAGEYRLVGWHEKIGWIFPGANAAARNLPVTVKNKEATELKPLPRKVDDDE
ncbi:MAG: hypothetical protein EBV06_10395 [Planctomycetia bacterium]|nr:hypothetical protein [Planctomycetia bacterium]